MRTMTHHGRGKGKNGHTFGTKHNDRSFDITGPESNIDPELTPENLVWHYYIDEMGIPEEPEKDEDIESLYCPMNWRLQAMLDEAMGTDYAAEDKARHFAKKASAADGKAMTFEQAEVRFYEEHFSAQLKETNDNYRKHGHPERCKDMAAWKNARRNAPEESIFQIGDMHVTGEYADAAILRKCYEEYHSEEQKWNDEHGNPFTVLDVAMHVDEPECPPHIQVRKVWHYKAEDGSLRLGQEKALERAGIELPDPSQAPGRRNNRKMTYDAMMREKWLDILERNGVKVERVPLPDRKRKGSRTHEQYLTDKYREMSQEAEKQAQRAAEAESRADAAEEQLKAAEGQVQALRDDMVKQKAIHDEMLQVNAEAMRVIKANNETIQKQEAIIQEQEQSLGLIQDYEEYCAVAAVADSDLDLGERMVRKLPPPKGIFKPAEEKEWLRDMKSMLQNLLSSIGEYLRRMQIFEVRYGMKERRSEPAQKRAAALNDMIAGAFARTEAAPDRSQTKEKDEPSL